MRVRTFIVEELGKRREDCVTLFSQNQLQCVHNDTVKSGIPILEYMDAYNKLAATVNYMCAGDAKTCSTVKPVVVALGDLLSRMAKEKLGKEHQSV